MTALSIWAATIAALAAPELRVRGHARIVLQGAQREARRSRFDGFLHDSSLQYGLADRTVTLRIVDEDSPRPTGIAVQTNAEGRFVAVTPFCAVRCTITLRFSGDEYYAPATFGPRTLEPAKPSVSLQLKVSPRMDASDSFQPIEIRASAVGLGIPLAVDLAANGQPVGRIQTDETGVGRFALPTQRLGAPGKKTLSAAFAGNTQLNPADDQVEVLLETPIRIDLITHRLEVDTDHEIDLYGEVRDLLGPVPHAAISLYARSKHAVSTRADETGLFRAAIPAKRLGPGSVDFVARYTPDVLWRRPARSSAIVVAVRPTPPPSPYLYAYSLLGTAALVGLLTLLRLRPSRLFRRVGQPKPSTRTAMAQQPGAITNGGVHASRRHALVRHDFGVQGTVWDPGGNHPVACALVRIDDGYDEIALEADQNGHFGAEHLAGGTYRVTVSSPGHVTEHFQITLPHRGQFRQMRVDLVPVKERILQLYQDVALPLLPRPSLWAHWTPRELLNHLDLSRTSTNAVSPALLELTSLLEQAYWSDGLADERMLARARECAASLASALQSQRHPRGTANTNDGDHADHSSGNR